MTRRQREAADWAALMRGTPSDADRRAFDAWRARPGNEDAYAQAVDDWVYTGGTSRQRIEAKARAETRAPVPMRWAVAAIALIGLAFGCVTILQTRDSERRIAADPVRPGELRLADGTLVTLMNGARLDPQLSATKRRVVLDGGRARFDVVHDPERPFVVIAGGSETVAIGTLFEVDAREAAPRITLIRGAVEVRSRTGGERLRLAPGEVADVTPTGPRRVDAAPTPAPTAFLDADQLPLSAVLDAASKSGASPIRLADPSLASLKVTGRFDISDSRALARKLTAALGLAIADEGDEIILTKAIPS